MILFAPRPRVSVYVCMSLCLCVSWTHQSMGVEVREQFLEIGFLLPLWDPSIKLNLTDLHDKCVL